MGVTVFLFKFTKPNFLLFVRNLKAAYVENIDGMRFFYSLHAFFINCVYGVSFCFF